MCTICAQIYCVHRLSVSEERVVSGSLESIVEHLEPLLNDKTIPTNAQSSPISPLLFLNLNVHKYTPSPAFSFLNTSTSFFVNSPPRLHPSLSLENYQETKQEQWPLQRHGRPCLSFPLLLLPPLAPDRRLSLPPADSSAPLSAAWVYPLRPRTLSSPSTSAPTSDPSTRAVEKPPDGWSAWPRRALETSPPPT